MVIKSPNKYYIFIALLVFNYTSFTQVTIPWGSAINVNFGKGSTNPGPPLSKGQTDFIYTTDSCPTNGYYTIANKVSCSDLNQIQTDAGHIFFGDFPMTSDTGYMMIATYSPSAISKILFSDTVKNLCSSKSYLFWAAIQLLSNSCTYPNLSFSAETISGQIIQSFQTGNIGGAGDKLALYLGYWPLPAPKGASMPFYYGVFFNMPAGINDVVLKIYTNPGGGGFSSCYTTFAVDNILLSPLGPTAKINPADNPDAWVTATCFQGGDPVNLQGSLNLKSIPFGNTNLIPIGFSNPAVQWQESIDNGYNWTDIPGATSLNFSHAFSVADTFFIRMRTSEANDISNLNCSVISNVVQVQVDGLPTDYTFTTNSPVCEDGDLVFNLEGGATYTVTGPNNFFDDSKYSHIYNPSLIDSGWYYAHIVSFGGCSVTDSSYVKITGPDIKAGTNQSICYADTVQLFATGGVAYIWTPARGLSDPNIADPNASPISTTKYKVTATDQYGCSAHTFVTIKLRDTILRAMIIGPDVVCPTDIVTIKDTSKGQIVNWQWDLGNGNSSSEKNPPPQNYIVANDFNYTVKLTVTDTSGCTNSTFHVLKSVNNCYITVPSAFTPNNDMHNDYLYPLNAYKASNLVFKVFNRDGKLVFETRDWTKKWDGNVGGIPQPTGTYVWTLDYNSETNQRVSLKGTTVLIR